MNRRALLLAAASAPLVAQLPIAGTPAMAGAAPDDQPDSDTTAAGTTFKVNVPAGPLWSNDQAQKLGPVIAAAHFGKFTGQWSTVVPSAMSVVEIELPSKPTGTVTHTMDVPAGPIWSNDDAKVKCPAICASYGGAWNGQWRTVVAGKMSVAGCTFTF